MRVLVLHSDIAPDAPPDERDTLVQAAAIAAALKTRGHTVTFAAFVPDPDRLAALVENARPEIVFNLVESVWGQGAYAPLAATMLESLGLPFTGAPAAAMAASGDKLLAKRLLSAAGVPTPAWAESPDWTGIDLSGRWIVKSTGEDASLGLDDGAVVAGRDAAMARASASKARYGGNWFAERYISGREFNVAILERDGVPVVLPIAEMRFVHWPASRPRIVGYSAKWDDGADARNTVRHFGWESESGLYDTLSRLARQCWTLFGCRGYARVDFRADAEGKPFVLELNANPCLEPGAGFAASAAKSGLSYDQLIEHIVRAVPAAGADIPRRRAG